MRRLTSKLSLLLVFLISTAASSQIIEFDLQGGVAEGISGQNENPPLAGAGTGDVDVNRIFFDMSTRILMVDIEWGAGNGYTDLSSDVDFMNIHGPTENDAPQSFSENAETLMGLDGFDPSASSGGYEGAIDIPEKEVQNLLNGRYYIHLHTFENDGGECRGYLIPAANMVRALTLFRGINIGGTLSDVQSSDDSYATYLPGFTLTSNEAPVWLVFEGSLLSPIVSELNVRLESSANTLGLTVVVEMFNWNSSSYVAVDSFDSSFNVDTVATSDVSSGIPNFVSGAGEVRTRIGWRQTGFTLLFPWEVQIDHVTWNTTD